MCVFTRLLENKKTLVIGGYCQKKCPSLLPWVENTQSHFELIGSCLISTGCVRASLLSFHCAARLSLRFHQQAPSLCLPPAPHYPSPQYALSALPSHPRLCSNAFLRPLVLKIRVNPDQLRPTPPPPPHLVFLLTHCSKIISVSH